MNLQYLVSSMDCLDIVRASSFELIVSMHGTILAGAMHASFSACLLDDWDDSQKQHGSLNCEISLFCCRRMPKLFREASLTSPGRCSSRVARRCFCLPSIGVSAVVSEAGVVAFESYHYSAGRTVHHTRKALPNHLSLVRESSK